MTVIPLDNATIMVRFNGIQGELAELEKLAKIPYAAFAAGVGFKLAQYHLHRALEGVFHISSHVLSRFPGGNQGGTYKEMAKLLGEKGIVTTRFAKDKLGKMAGYRNRLVHFYADITPKEIYRLINDDLGDIENFLRSIKTLIGNPGKFGLTIK